MILLDISISQIYKERSENRVCKMTQKKVYDKEFKIQAIWTIVNKVDRKREKNNTYWGQASIRLPGNWGGQPQGLYLKNYQRIKIKLFFLIRRKHIISRMRPFTVIKPFNILKKRKFQLRF